MVKLDYRDWDVSGKIKDLETESITVSRASLSDKEELFEFISEEWELWLNELEMAFKNNPVSLYIARLAGKIKAFSAYDGNNVGTGWFGPMGTHKDLRGKGIGSVLLFLCLKDIKDKGLSSAIIPWVGPISFYSHYAGATIDRVFWRYEKDLTN